MRKIPWLSSHQQQFLQFALGWFSGIFTGLGLVLLFIAIRPTLAVWVDPDQPPPGGNIEPPLNTSTVSQIKKGGLGLNCGKDCTVFNPSNAFEIYGGVLNPQVAASIDETGKLTADAVETRTLTVSESLTIKGDVTVEKDATVQGFSQLSGGVEILKGATIDEARIGPIQRPVTIGKPDESMIFTDSGSALHIQNKGNITIDGMDENIVAIEGLNISDNAMLSSGPLEINTTNASPILIGNSSQSYSSDIVTISGMSSSGKSALYVEDQGSGFATSFSGKVKLIQGIQGGLTTDIFDRTTPIMAEAKGADAIKATASESGAKGVHGIGKEDAIGVAGESPMIGVQGSSTLGIGVSGTTSSSDDTNAGVYAESNNKAPAFIAEAKGLGQKKGKAGVFKGEIEVNESIQMKNDQPLRFDTKGEQNDKPAYFEYRSIEKCLYLIVGDKRVSAWPEDSNSTCKPNCSAGGGFCYSIEVGGCILPTYSESSNFFCSEGKKCCILTGAPQEPEY